MSCRNKRRYFVINHQTSMVYGYTKDRELGWIANLPWIKPYLFQTIKAARKIAEENRCSTYYWQGKIYKNSPDNNVM